MVLAQPRRIRGRIRSARSAVMTLLVCMLLGSLSGALCVRISDFMISDSSVFRTGQASLLLSFPRFLFFPSLMTAAVLFHCRRLFCLLFFCKGFTVAYTLCACAAAGIGVMKGFLPGFFLETLLPLPAMLLLGALWYEDAAMDRTSLWPLLPALLPASVGLLLEGLIFQ